MRRQAGRDVRLVTGPPASVRTRRARPARRGPPPPRTPATGRPSPVVAGHAGDPDAPAERDLDLDRPARLQGPPGHPGRAGRASPARGRTRTVTEPGGDRLDLEPPRGVGRRLGRARPRGPRGRRAEVVTRTGRPATARRVVGDHPAGDPPGGDQGDPLGPDVGLAVAPPEVAGLDAESGRLDPDPDQLLGPERRRPSPGPRRRWSRRPARPGPRAPSGRPARAGGGSPGPRRPAGRRARRPRTSDRAGEPSDSRTGRPRQRRAVDRRRRRHRAGPIGPEGRPVGAERRRPAARSRTGPGRPRSPGPSRPGGSPSQSPPAAITSAPGAGRPSGPTTRPETGTGPASAPPSPAAASESQRPNTAEPPPWRRLPDPPTTADPPARAGAEAAKSSDLGLGRGIVRGPREEDGPIRSADRTQTLGDSHPAGPASCLIYAPRRPLGGKISRPIPGIRPGPSDRHAAGFCAKSGDSSDDAGRAKLVAARALPILPGRSRPARESRRFRRPNRPGAIPCPTQTTDQSRRTTPRPYRRSQSRPGTPAKPPTLTPPAWEGPEPERVAPGAWFTPGPGFPGPPGSDRSPSPGSPGSARPSGRTPGTRGRRPRRRPPGTPRESGRTRPRPRPRNGP